MISSIIVACSMLGHSFLFSMAVQSCWILAETLVHVDPENPKHAEWVMCLVAAQARMLSASRICVQILVTRC